MIVLLVGCAGNLENLVGVDNPAKPAPTVPGTTRHTIYIATSRQEAEDPTVFFTKQRDLRSVNFARVDVYIPPKHKPGYVERPKTSPPDPRKDFVILDPVKFANQTAFQNSVDRSIDSRLPDDREIMLFVHGFNTDIVAAILRAAQITHDSGFQGVTVVFSWASAGKTLDYVYDLNSALHARDGLIQTAEALLNTRTTGLSVVAHSMGNFLTVEAMRQAQLLNLFNASGKLENIILASPDIDIDVFKTQLKVFPKSKRRFYVLISENDKALAVSRRLAGGVPRVGNDTVEDLAELGVTVIDLTNVDDTSSLNHTKFADSPEIVQLIGKRLQEGDKLDEPRTPIENIPAAAKVLTGGVGGSGGIIVFE
jgi:esterase/lipase superfamily enzyme